MVDCCTFSTLFSSSFEEYSRQESRRSLQDLDSAKAIKRFQILGETLPRVSSFTSNILTYSNFERQLNSGNSLSANPIAPRILIQYDGPVYDILCLKLTFQCCGFLSDDLPLRQAAQHIRTLYIGLPCMLLSSEVIALDAIRRATQFGSLFLVSFKQLRVQERVRRWNGSREVRSVVFEDEVQVFGERS